MLKGSAWVEFPEIQLMARENWEEMVDKGEAIITEIEAISQVSGRERDSGWGAKRRLNEVAEGKVQHNGTKRLKSESNQGLLALGEYDSEEGSDAENGAEEADDVSAEEAQDQDPSPEILAAVGRALMADWMSRCIVPCLFRASPMLPPLSFLSTTPIFWSLLSLLFSSYCCHKPCLTSCSPL